VLANLCGALTGETWTIRSLKGREIVSCGKLIFPIAVKLSRTGITQVACHRLGTDDMGKYSLVVISKRCNSAEVASVFGTQLVRDLEGQFAKLRVHKDHGTPCPLHFSGDNTFHQSMTLVPSLRLVLNKFLVPQLVLFKYKVNEAYMFRSNESIKYAEPEGLSDVSCLRPLEH
jgi:hypothetical protein